MSKPEDIPPEVRNTVLAILRDENKGELGVLIARAILAAKAETLPHHDLVDCLSDMTEHYVSLAGCGDCGNWDPEKESEVIAARRMIALHRQVNTAHKISED